MSSNLEKGMSLGVHDEMLLMSYLDGELGFLGRARARRLLKQNPKAVRFVEELRVVGDHIPQRTEGGERVDLWDRVSQRIDQEIRAEVLLGKREQRSRFHWRLPEISWGLGGAVAAAAVMFMVADRSSIPGTELASNSPAMINLNLAPEAHNVALGSASAAYAGGTHARPRIIDPSYPSSVEVDWMRSNGRVRVIEDPTERSTILWIHKRDPRGSASLPSRLPYSFSQPNSSIALPLEGLVRPPLNRSSISERQDFESSDESLE